MDYQKLYLLIQCNKKFSHAKIRLQDLSDTECMLCTYIYFHPNCSQEDAAVSLKADKTTVGKALTSLECKNCVVRTQDTADKRIKRLSLTDLGQRKIETLVNLHNNWLHEVMSCLSAEEQQQFEHYCDRLLAAAEALILNSAEHSLHTAG